MRLPDLNFRVIVSIFCWLMVSIPTDGFAQITSMLMTDSVSPVPENLIEPQFKGGEARLFKILEANIVYPSEAKRDGVSGTVVVEFTVDTTGTATDITIFQGVRLDINREAARVVGLLQDWTPATYNGRKVGVVYKLPIRFSLPNHHQQKPLHQNDQLAPFLKWKR